VDERTLVTAVVVSAWEDGGGDGCPVTREVVDKVVLDVTLAAVLLLPLAACVNALKAVQASLIEVYVTCRVVRGAPVTPVVKPGGPLLPHTWK
jgi:hypothetical protein